MVTVFKRSYSVLLGFPEDELYSIILIDNIYLGSPKNINFTMNL